MKKTNTIIIGGGASGLMLANMLDCEFLLFERGDRVGKKLSATGNGQGNLTNEKMDASHYFSVAKGGEETVRKILEENGKNEMISFFEDLGGLFLADERGRVYPTGRQASALCDLLRFPLARKNCIKLFAKVEKIERTQSGFVLSVSEEGKVEKYEAKNVVVATGGKVAKNFGSDGNGYQLVKPLSHTTTPLYPSLVQLKTETKHLKSLKGIRVVGASVRALLKDGICEERGDVIFTDYGVSGDAIFRISAHISHLIEETITLSIDFLPDVEEEKLTEILAKKLADAKQGVDEVLCGILNNQLGRSVMKRVKEKTAPAIASMVKNFTLPVLGTLGYDYAQVTKGGIPLEEVGEDLQSKKSKGLYFVGEILDVDGECGGYNLQWAFSSACAVAKALKGE